MTEVHGEITRDRQIWKFCFYGLLKNLKFFEPYLIIYLMGLGLDLFQIGLLYSLREIVVYVFEVPSGVLADRWGRRRELMLCFLFYIISFLLFFIGGNFALLTAAMFFFGLGEAFRSGTHKAMIYTYLEQRGWFGHKTFVYGRTRSFSLVGSSVSAFLSIIFVLNLPAMRWIFLLCVVPYLLDFLLIWSYPESLDGERHPMGGRSLFAFGIRSLRGIFTDWKLTRILLSSAVFDSVFRCIKDYVQPVLSAILLTSVVASVSSGDVDARLKIWLGVIYGVFYIFSSMASRNVWRVKTLADSGRLMDLSLEFMGLLLLALFPVVRAGWAPAIAAVFFVLYVLKDARRPIFVDVCGDHMDKDVRATVLSVDSQLRSIFTVVLAPLLGYLAETFSLPILFLVLGIVITAASRILKIEH